MPSSAMPMVSMQILFRLIIRQREPNNLSRATYRRKKLNIIAVVAILTSTQIIEKKMI